jgi:hypothetical protein
MTGTGMLMPVVTQQLSILMRFFFVVDTLKIPQRNGPLAGGVENFPVETSVFIIKRSQSFFRRVAGACD